MNKNTVVIVTVVVIALLCSAVPSLVPVLLGVGNQSGAISSETTRQLLTSVLFLGITKISGVSLLVSISGLAFSLYFLTSNPKKFRFTSIAFVLFLIGAILSGLLSAWIKIGSLNAGTALVPSAMAAASCLSSLLQITAWVLLFMIIFPQKEEPSVGQA